jgi:hypothetical protein
VCVWCGGEKCLACSFTGVRPVEFALERSRTCAQRTVRYEPVAAGGGRLTLTRKRTPNAAPQVTRYFVNEVACQRRGRAFRLVKVGARERYELFVGKAGHASCSCAGETYLSTAKANERARTARRAMFPGMGCVHLDAIQALLAAGYFDLGLEAQEVRTSDDPGTGATDPASGG